MWSLSLWVVYRSSRDKFSRSMQRGRAECRVWKCRTEMCTQWDCMSIELLLAGWWNVMAGLLADPILTKVKRVSPLAFSKAWN